MCIKSKGSRKMHTQRLKRETSKGKRRGKQTEMRCKIPSNGEWNIELQTCSTILLNKISLKVGNNFKLGAV